MKSGHFLLLALLLCFGLGPATAQDIYISRYKKDPSRKKTVYISRDYSQKNKRNTRQKDRARARYNDQLRIGQNIHDVEEKIDIFHAWEASGRQPETTEEILSYANARRAVHQKVMLRREKSLIAYLAKKDIQRDRRLAREGRQKDNSQFSFQSPSSGTSGSKTSKKTTRQTIVQKPGLYVKQKKKSGSSKGGVFTGYR